MDGMLRVLDRSNEQKAALKSLLDAQQDPASPEYHKWLTPEEWRQSAVEAGAGFELTGQRANAQALRSVTRSTIALRARWAGDSGKLWIIWRAFSVNVCARWYARAMDPLLSSIWRIRMKGTCS